MKEYTERRQLNNEGFSLIELLIAIVILSIIVVPLLHSFVTSARTNAKSRNTMHATAIAEDVMEQFEAHTLEEMADTYETVTPTDFTNNVQRDVSLDVDGDGSAEAKRSVPKLSRHPSRPSAPMSDFKKSSSGQVMNPVLMRISRGASRSATPSS